MWESNVVYCDISVYELFISCPQTETTKCVQAKEVEQGLLAGQPQPVLPDCVPTEIKSMCDCLCVIGYY